MGLTIMAEPLRSVDNGYDSPADMIVFWQEKGHSDAAVATYGTSVESLLQIVQSGIVPPYIPNPDIPYQLALTDHGNRNLYFFLPFLEKISAVRPELVNDIMAGFTGFSVDKIYEALTPAKAKDSAGGYAQFHVLKDQAHLLLGTNTSDLRSVLLALFSYNPQAMSLHIEQNPALVPIVDDEYDDALPLSLPDEMLSELLKRITNRKGVLIYYNSSILTHKTYAGIEDPHELLVVADEPLSISAIDGIEFLSRADRDAFFELLESGS